MNKDVPAVVIAVFLFIRAGVSKYFRKCPILAYFLRLTPFQGRIKEAVTVFREPF
jgi:hypothetical protein